MRLAMMGLLDPTFKENYAAAPRCSTSSNSQGGHHRRLRVQDGAIRRDSEIKVMRDGVQVFKGKIGSLKRFKDDAREVTNAWSAHRALRLQRPEGR